MLKQKISPASTDFLDFSISITSKCNLNCGHCFKDSFEEDLVLSEMKTVLHNLDDFHYFLSIGGGEPLMHENFAEIIEAAKNENALFSFTTNGILVSEELIQNIKSEGLCLVKVSIDKFHKNSKEGKQAVKSLIKNDVNTIISSVLGENYDDILSINRFCEKIGVKHKIIRKKDKDVDEDPARLRKTLDRLNSNITIIDNSYPYKITGEKRECNIGNSFHLSNNRNIYCCHFTEDEEFKIGTIEDLPGCLTNFNPKKYKEDDCVDCQDYNKCKGGCPLMRHLNQSENEIDPLCL